jgi:hypothetical protein
VAATTAPLARVLRSEEVMPVIARVVEVALVVEPLVASKELGKMTWLGRERVQVRLVERSWALAEEVSWFWVPAMVKVVALEAGVKPKMEELAAVFKVPSPPAV